jgi:DNA helicase-2/ATP-dependent DNA helicase PcrA
MSPDYLTDLNEEQRRAVEHGVDSESAMKAPPLLVIAGAGSGKTKTLAHRVAHLLISGVDPHRILLLTFTRRAAEEMIRRVKRITAIALGVQQVDLPWSGTFHAVGARFLRQYATQIVLKPSFTILDRSDAADLMDLVRHELGHSTKNSRFPKKDTCLSIYSFTVNSGKSLEQVLAENFPWCAEWEKELRRLFQSYTAAKQRQNVLDYDDLLLYWAEMMGDDNLAAEIGSRFDHILVDEYQDTNGLQSKFLIFQNTSGPPLTSSLLSKTIDQPNRSSTPATGSSGLPKNGTQRTYGLTGGPSKSRF